MPVDPDRLDEIAATVAALYRDAETALAALVARTLADGIDAPGWAERKLAAAGALRRSASAILAALQADSGRAIVEAAAQAYRAGWTSALAELPERWFPRSGLGEQARRAAEQMPGFAAVEALATAVHADIGERARNILRDVVDAYREVITAASARIVTGAQTRRQAAQAAWRRLVDRGLAGFTDRAGRRWQLSTYVEMATRTVAQRAAVTGQTDRLDALGVRLVYASNAPHECALCRPYEGRILRLDPGPTGRVMVRHQLTDEPLVVEVEATLDEARRRGFLHPNCRHSVSAYLPGVTRLPAQPTADPAGDRARQRQREIERHIRKWKTREAAALTDEDRARARRAVRGWQAAMREHLAAHPTLKRLPYRERIGAGNIPRRGEPVEPAGDVGPAVELTIDSDQVPARRALRVDQEAPAGQGAPADPDQLDLLDQPAVDQVAGQPDTVEELGDQVAAGGALAGVDLSEWSDDELADGLATFADDPDALDAILAEMDRREQLAEQAGDLVDEELGDQVDRARLDTDQGGDEPGDVDPGEARRQRDRARRDRERAEREQRIWETFDRLVAAGWSEEEAWAEATGRSVEQIRREEAIARLRAEGYTGRGFDELARAAYRDHVDRLYWLAEEETNGFLLTREGEARGIDPRELFTGPEARARKWASDELKQFWDRYGRPTFEEFAAELLGDTGAAGDARARRGDFLQ